MLEARSGNCFIPTSYLSSVYLCWFHTHPVLTCIDVKPFLCFPVLTSYPSSVYQYWPHTRPKFTSIDFILVQSVPVLMSCPCRVYQYWRHARPVFSSINLIPIQCLPVLTSYPSSVYLIPVLSLLVSERFSAHAFLVETWCGTHPGPSASVFLAKRTLVLGPYVFVLVLVALWPRRVWRLSVEWVRPSLFDILQILAALSLKVKLV